MTDSFRLRAIAPDLDCADSGGNPSQVLLAVDQGVIYWVTPDHRLRKGVVDADGKLKVVGPVLDEADGDGNPSQVLLAVDQGVIYWVTPDHRLRKGVVDADGKLKVVGPVLDEADGDGNPSQVLLAVDQGVIYWVTPDHRLRKGVVDADGKLKVVGPVLDEADGDGNPSQVLLAVDQGVIYWVTPRHFLRKGVVNDEGHLKAVGPFLDGPMPDERPSQVLLAVDQGIYYWTTPAPESRLRRGYVPPFKYLLVGDLVDVESRCVRKPFDDSFGDSCWRSAWTYASLFVLRDLAPDKYDAIREAENISIDDARRFVRFFAEHCSSDNGLKVWGSDQQYTSDQLLPLLYLLACVKRFDNHQATLNAAESIVKNLRELEQHCGSLSDGIDATRVVGRNGGYLIFQLCNQYGINYQWWSRPAWLAAALVQVPLNVAQNIIIAADNVIRAAIWQDPLPLLETDNAKIADHMYERFLRFSFDAGLAINEETAHFEGADIGVEFGEGFFHVELSADDLIDGFSVFNALAAMSQLRVGNGMSDWRDRVQRMSDLGWGPAFDIVSGENASAGVEDSTDWRVLDSDNDIVQSQRPAKFMDSTFPDKNEDGVKTLDHIILQALSALWS